MLFYTVLPGGIFFQMDSTPTFLLVAIILVILSSFFSATETAFTSLSKIKIKGMVNTGNKKAAKVLEVCDKYDKLLTTLLVGNNIVNISLSTIATLYFVAHWETYGATLSTVVITIVVLIFGEITPKNIAKEIPESFAMFAVNVIYFLMVILTPINIIFTGWKKLLFKIFKFKKSAAVTEEDIITIVKEAENEGEIDSDESEIIKSAITFNDLDVQSVLTPRVKVVAIEKDSTKEDVFDTFKSSGFTRIPVYEDNIDKIIGIVNLKDFYEKVMLGNSCLKDIIVPVRFITTYSLISDVLRLLQNDKSHLAVVVDEFGGTVGIVTVEDILEELVGEIYDERDDISTDIVKQNNDTYIVKGNLEIDKLPEELDFKPSDDYTTVAGWVIHSIEKIPNVGECFIVDGKKITVIKMEDNRIDEIAIAKIVIDSEKSDNQEESEEE